MKILPRKIVFGNDAAVLEKIEGIPGLRIHAAQGFAVGSVDAVGAAALAIGEKPKQDGAPDAVSYRDLTDTLRKYQVAGVQFVLNTVSRYGGAILADDMGLGKTLQVLKSVSILKTKAGRVLILCPAAALETWRDELQKWGFGDSSAVLTSTQSKAAKAQWAKSPKATWVVCSYDYRIVERCMMHAFSTIQPEFLILDEAHRLRGRNSKRSAMLQTVRPMCEKAIAMTATPQFNRPKDLYQLLHILFGYWFGNQYDFDKRYCGAYPGQHGGLEYPKKGSFNAEELKHRLSYFMLRREKREVAHELPPLTIQVRWVDPTSEAKKVFLQAQMNLARTKLHDAVVATLKGKVQECLDLAVESRQFVLATWMKTHAREFHRMLNSELDTPCVLVTGEMPVEERARAIKMAEAKRWGVVATTDSISESLNLQHVASVGILHALDWVPLKLAQLFARIHRLGSIDPVIWYLVAMRETVDQLIIDSQVSKLDQYRDIFGRKSFRDMRNSLADEKAVAEAEKEALKAIYERMKS